MNRRIRLWVAAALLALTAVSQRLANAESLLKIDLLLAETTHFDGNVSYSLGVGFSTFRPDRLATLRAPSGNTYQNSWQLRSDFQSWEEIASELFGEWTFISAPVASPTDVQEYRFTAARFEPDSLSPELPELSPPNLSFVRSPFTVTSTALNNSVGLTMLDGIIDGGSEYIQAGEAKVTFDRIVSEEAYLTVMSSSSNQYLSEFISVTMRPAVNAHYFVSPSLQFTRRAEARYFPAIPEPSTAVLAVLSGGVALGVPSRGARSRRLRRPQG